LVTPPPSDTPVIQIPPPAPQKESLFKLPPPSTVVESKHSSSGSGSDLAAKLGLKDVVRFVRKKLRKLF
jgi:hypothetical protein